MNDTIILILFIYYMVIGTFGGVALSLEFDKPYINLWKYLRGDFKFIGCLLIYILIHSVILFTLLCDIFWYFINIIIDIFYVIFKKGDDK